ncbi:MAG: eukaryotic-like serine/threonine-protein kinase [Verrucomicrobiota bacterium]|jgi:serine/threonine-protein kinase
MATLEQAQLVAEIVEAALERDAADWPSFLDESCGDNLSLRKEVESLLGYQKEAKDFIEAPAYVSAAGSLAEKSGELGPGDVLGEYKILSLLGEGGMGEVYLAEDSNLHRQVAIKLVKAGFGRANLLRHFQREERILAALTHPNIARLYGGAVSETGIPYFVMEYIEGERLDRYCETRELKLPERLQLFRKICSAVSYAHQHLVIHRDIKPANIRVTPEGEPKLLDFGIAKLIDPQSESLAEATMTLQRIMTPEYASPEQVRGEEVTTATDIYSLGVVLYELLAGRRPYHINTRSPDEVARAITGKEPPRPSAAIVRGGKLKDRTQRLLRGDLDNIVLMAMRKEPARRYASVAQFSEDIRRHLGGLPVVARKDTMSYRSAKFVRRHRVGVAAATLVATAIIVGLIAALWEARQARAQRDVARRINTFLQDMLGAAAPEVKGVDVKVADLLDEASRRARTELTSQPDVMADVLMILGRTFISLGKPDKAESDLRAALDASLRANGELHPTTATTMGWLGLALAYLNRNTEGEQISRKAVALQRKLHPRGHEDLGVALYALGYNLIGENEPKAAQIFLKESSGLIKKHLGQNHGYYMASLVMLAMAHEKAGEIDLAEPLYRQAIAVGGRVEPRYRIFLAQAELYLGILLITKKAYAEAETLLRESETIYRQVMGGDTNFSVASAKANLGLIYFLNGNYAKAEAEDKKALDLLRQSLGPDQPVFANTASTLGLVLTREGKAEDGEVYLRDALTIRKKILAAGDFMIPYAASALGECLTMQKRYAEAEPLLIDSYHELKSKLGDQNKRTLEARQRLVKLYELWEKPELAVRYR